MSSIEEAFKRKVEGLTAGHKNLRILGYGVAVVVIVLAVGHMLAHH